MEETVQDETDFSLTYGDITSPSQLQEVTLEQDITFSNSMGLRSPGGPMRGRSVKEFEEQLTSLKKENFNLKLRIYFLEERMGSNFNLDKENVVKKNVELMVEVESLRKELQEKHDLLCQAVKAMELEDEEHKKLVTQKEEVISEYQQEIENLKTQLLDLKPETVLLSPKSCMSDPAELFNVQQDSSSAIKNLQEKINSLEEELKQEKENNVAVQMVLDQTNSRIKELSAQLEETSKTLSSREDEFKEMSFVLEETRTRCQGLLKKLQEKTQLLDELSSEKDQLHKRQTMLRADVDKERKRYEKLKTESEQKIAELQSKLEAALNELKKSQELVVSSQSPARRLGNTDADSFSVQKPATPPRSPQKDTLVPLSIPSPTVVTTPVSSPSPSISFNLESGSVDLKHVIEQLKTDRDLQQQKIVKLKAEQMKACKIIKSMIDSRNKTNEEIAALKRRNEELEIELEGVVTRQGASTTNNTTTITTNRLPNENLMDEQSGELVEHYKALTDELEEKNRILMATLGEKDSQMKKIQEQYEEMLKINKEKQEHIVDLEFELLAMTQDKNSKGDDERVSHYIEFYKKQVKERDEEIKRLNSKLLKRNCDLQGLVNNELWEKNREIEKLQTKQALKTIEIRDHEIELQNDLKAKKSQLDIIKEKISELGIDIDLQNGDVNVENNLRLKLEKSEKLRLEAYEVCGVLSRRLEELASFLDSLLKEKSVLGFLGNKENKRLRQIIDQSLDLSRSFTMSMIINPEQSLMQLSNITSLLNDTEPKLDDDEEDGHEASTSRLSLVPTSVSLAYRSQLYKKDNERSSQIIEALRQENLNLKYELQLRDVEWNKINGGGADLTEISSEKDEEEKEGEVMQKSALNTTSTTLKYKSDNQSESEAWSEPDRSVSRARIGLLDGSLRSNSSRRYCSNTSTDSTEDEEGGRLSRTPSSKKCVLTENRITLLELHKQKCELDQKLNDREIAYFDATKANNKLKQELENLEIRLKVTEGKLAEAEMRKVETEHRVEQLQKEKDELLERLKVKDKDLENKINMIEVEKLEAVNVAKEAEEAANIAKNDMKIAEMKLKSMQQEIKELEVNLRSEYEKEILEKIQRVENESMKKIKQIQNSAEMEIKSLHETLQQLQMEYSTNYVKKSEVEEALDEIDRLKTEMESMEERMEELSSEEQCAKKKLTEYEEKINSLRSDLDNATLQYSEAVLEKTKMANEKALVEQELSKSILKEVDTKKRLDEVENELSLLKHSHQKQLSALQMQKSNLEVRISELESSNAELHNRLVKIQAGCGDHMTSSSLPNASNFVNQIVSFRRQHSENSGYLSEDPMLVEDMRIGHSRSFHRLVPNPNIDIERNEANSSPDLGIESDHGRFSSLETNVNVQRPLLQTLELTESMSNLLDMENNQVEEVDCGNTHCCQKTMEMAHENSDLKRKLLRTRRALEETVTQLTLANQRKKQVEKTICKQIHKTSQVLRKAKANLDSGSETDMYRK